MPFKSEKQRKWMHANEPDMAKKWEKEEVIRGKLRNLIKQEMKSINEAKPKSFKFKFQCMECGKSFIKSLKKSLEVKCPKCKSVDIELENVNEDNIKFSKEEMAQLHKDGKVEKGDHTIEFNESTKEYGKTLDKIAKDRQLKSISKKDRDALIKIAKLMKRANESTSLNEGFEKYHLGGLLDSKLKKRLERAIKIWGGKIDAVGDDYIKFRLSSFEVKKFPALLKKLDRNKNVWIGDKRKKNIWDRRQRINKLEATTSVSVPGYLSPHAFSKSTQNAIDIDDEDDEKSESMVAPFRRRKSRGLGRPMKVGLNESDLGLTYKKGKTVKVTHKKSGKELIIIDKPNVRREYQKIGYFAEGTVNELQMAPFSSSEARQHINQDIKKMSKELGKTSHDIIKMMMDGVKGGKYTAMDIARGVKEGPAGRTHFGEMTFIQSLWNKVRDKFRRYSKHGKLS